MGRTYVRTLASIVLSANSSRFHNKYNLRQGQQTGVVRHRGMTPAHPPIPHLLVVIQHVCMEHGLLMVHNPTQFPWLLGYFARRSTFPLPLYPFRMVSAKASKSILFRAVNGLDMFNNSHMTFPFNETTKAPFRGRSPFKNSPFTDTLSTNPFDFKAFSRLAALVLNTPQLLQCSMVRPAFSLPPVVADDADGDAGDAFFALVPVALLVLADFTALLLGAILD